VSVPVAQYDSAVLASHRAPVLLPDPSAEPGFSPAPRTGRAAQLTRTVPREFVHRAAVAEVLLTGWRRETDTTFRLAAQWPRSHSFYAPVLGLYHDPLLAGETIRQAGLLLSHAEFGVSLGDQFLMSALEFTVVPRHTRVAAAPADLDLRVTCNDIRLRGRRLAGMRIDVVIERGGELAVYGSAEFSVISGPAYRKLRGDRPRISRVPVADPVPAGTVGRAFPKDVVLSATHRPRRWQLRLDTGHPVVEQHRVDHAPGMLLIEAARQATLALVPCDGYLPVTVRSRFDRYAELDSPHWIEAAPIAYRGDGRTGVEITGSQDSETVFTCAVEAIPAPAR
jgi:hypothetical protein